MTTSNDEVNFPSHYTGGEVESIDAIWSTGHGAGFCLGNAIKYLHRAGKKGDDTLVKDLKKAQWYVAFLLSKLDSGCPDPRTERGEPKRGVAEKTVSYPHRIVLTVEVERRSIKDELARLRANLAFVDYKITGGNTARLDLRDGTKNPGAMRVMAWEQGFKIISSSHVVTSR
jgi:hypothetical protein